LLLFQDDRETDMISSPSTSAICYSPLSSYRESGHEGGSSSCDDDVEKIGQIRCFPEADRFPEFKRLAGASEVLAPEADNTRFIALSRQIEHLPQDRRWEAFGLLCDAPDIFDEARLTALAEQIQYLHIDERLIKFSALLQMNREILAEHPPAFIGQIRHLGKEQRKDVFNLLMGDAPQSDRQRRGVYFEALAGQLTVLHKMDRADGYAGILRKVGQAPTAEQRIDELVALVGPLAENIPGRPGDGESRWPEFCNILDKIAAHPDERQRAAYLTTLIGQITNLPEHLRGDVFTNMLRQIRAYGLDQRLARDSCGELLIELNSQIGCLPLTVGAMKSEQQLMASVSIRAVVRNLNLEEVCFAGQIPKKPPPEQYAQPAKALQSIKELVELCRENPIAAAGTITEQQRDGGHIGLWVADLASRNPVAGGASLEAYLELVSLLRDADHLKPHHVRALLLPAKKEEKYQPISSVVASHWQPSSSLMQLFVGTLVDAVPKEYAKEVVRLLGLKQSGVDFYKLVKYGMNDLPAKYQDTPALRLLAEHGLIPSNRELGKIAKNLRDAPATASPPVPTIDQIAARIDERMPRVLQQEAERRNYDADMERVRADHQASWQAAHSEPEGEKPSPIVGIIAGLSNQLHAQGAAAHARKQQSIAQREQDLVAQKQSEEQQSRQQRDGAGPSWSNALALAMQTEAPSRASSGLDKKAEPAYIPAQEHQRTVQHEAGPSDAQRTLGCRAAKQAAAAAENLHNLQTLAILSRGPSVSTLPALDAPSAPVPMPRRGRRAAIAE
jgi:hypothetical protein